MGTDPVTGNGVLLSLDDDGSGPFLVITDLNNLNCSIRVELDQLELILTEARSLISSVQRPPVFERLVSL
jgi:hypothetical protein